MEFVLMRCDIKISSSDCSVSCHTVRKIDTGTFLCELPIYGELSAFCYVAFCYGMGAV